MMFKHLAGLKLNQNRKPESMQGLRGKVVYQLGRCSRMPDSLVQRLEKEAGTVSYLKKMLCKTSSRCHLTGTIIIYFLRKT